MEQMSITFLQLLKSRTFFSFRRATLLDDAKPHLNIVGTESTHTFYAELNFRHRFIRKSTKILFKGGTENIITTSTPAAAFWKANVNSSFAACTNMKTGRQPNMISITHSLYVLKRPNTREHEISFGMQH